jgi:ferrous iron transport protein A
MAAATASERSLADHKPGDEVRVAGVSGAGNEALADRLRALGFVPGTKIQILRRAPLGDPTEYALRGTRISLRRAEAGRVAVVCAEEG